MADTAAPPPSSSTTSESKSKASFAEVQETVNRLAAHNGVTSVLILNKAGDILTQTGQGGAVGNPRLLKQTLDAAARYVQSIPNEQDEHEAENQDADPEGNNASRGPFDLLSFVRIRARHEEILIAPKNQYVLVVFQDPHQSSL